LREEGSDHQGRNAVARSTGGAFWPIYRDYDVEQNKLIDQKLKLWSELYGDERRKG
jgi:hypothetical protein